MRLAIALLALLGSCSGNPATPALAAADSGYVLAMAQQPGQYSIDIDVNGADAAWWTNPLWIGIGVVALVLLVVIIALAVEAARPLSRNDDRQVGQWAYGPPPVLRSHCGNRPVAASNRDEHAALHGQQSPQPFRHRAPPLRVDQLDIRVRPP